MAYMYQKLGQKPPEIRLIKMLARQKRLDTKEEADVIHCEIFHTDLDSHPDYKALSYTWGDPLARTASIQLNGCPFTVKENLMQALRHMQHEHDDLIIWIDAICINQLDMLERGHQVTLMGRIYGQATEVLVWLGPAAEDSDLAFGLVRAINEHCDDTQWILRRFQEPDMPKEIAGLIKVLSRPWFDRMWIVQETVLGAQVKIQCGDSLIDAGGLDRFQACIGELKMSNGLFLTHQLPCLPDEINTLVWRGLRPIWATRSILLSGKLRLFEAMQYNSTKASTDLRDMVYGLLGLESSDQIGSLKVDYSADVAHVYADFVRYEIQDSQTLDVLTYVLWSVTNTFPKPSWVPDWSAKRRGHTRLCNIREPHFRYRAGGTTKAQVSFSSDLTTIVIGGIILGHVEQSGQATKMDHRADVNQALLVFTLWAGLVNSVTNVNRVVRDIAFSRTLLANRFLPTEIADLGRPAEEFLQLLLGAWVEWAIEIHGSSILGSSPVLSGWVAYRRMQAGTDDDNVTRVLRLWIRDSCRYIWDRTLIVSSVDGFIGLAPETAEVGDIVCVPFGCSIPMLLRPVNDHFLLVGESYIDDNMYGEAIKRSQLQPELIQDFELR